VESLPNPLSDNGLNNYFNKAIDNFFWHYLPSGGGNTLHLYSSVTGITYLGTVTHEGTANGGYVLRLSGGGDNFDIYYPFFTSNTPSDYTPALNTTPAPNRITKIESPSQMVFACDGVFADNIARGLTGTAGKVLADLENSISAALNRGIAMNPADTWGDPSTWYPEGEAYNYWVEFWHQSGLTDNGLAYAFPYDDKFGTSTNLSENNVAKATITLGTWTDTTIKSTTTFENFPMGAALQGPISLTAKVAAADTATHPLTGTVSFFINGVPINSNDFGAIPPVDPRSVDGTTGEATISATLPLMPDGNTPHTYTVTAVYSGDEYRAPSIAYDELALSPAFQLGFSANNVPLGSQVTLDVTLSTGAPSGTVEFSISHADGTGEQFLGSVDATSAHLSKQVTIPANLLQFTGDPTTTQNGKQQTIGIINKVSNFTGVRLGQILTGAGLPSGTTVSNFTKHQLTLSQPISKAGTGNVMLTVNGRTFAAFIPPTEPTTVNGIDMIADLKVGDTVAGLGVAPMTTISSLIPGSIGLSDLPTTGSDVTITSNAAEASFPTKVTYKPTTAPSISTVADIGIVA
jgi:hypothetical protein